MIQKVIRSIDRGKCSRPHATCRLRRFETRDIYAVDDNQSGNFVETFRRPITFKIPCISTSNRKVMERKSFSSRRSSTDALRSSYLVVTFRFAQQSNKLWPEQVHNRVTLRSALFQQCTYDTVTILQPHDSQAFVRHRQ